MDLGLLQREAAEEIGADLKTLINWEVGRSEPELRFLPVVIRFLGYDPRPEPKTLGERIRWTREREGISQRELARRLGVDITTVQAWEVGTARRQFPRFRRLFEEYVKSA